MTETQQLCRIRRLMAELLAAVEPAGRGKIDFQLRELRRGIDGLDEFSRLGGDPAEIQSELRQIGRSLYPARGGLTDFSLWQEDEAARIAQNTRIGRLNDALWQLLA